MTPEHRITAALMRRLKQLRAAGAPVWWLKLHGHAMQRAGVPDLLIVLGGRVLFVEVKAAGGRLSRLQRQTLAELRRAGASAIVARSADDIESWF